MAFIPDEDVNDSDFVLSPIGWHKVEVAEAEQKRSKRTDDRYWNLKLVDPNTKSTMAWDVIMLEGKGNGIGLRKLAAIGMAEKVDGGWDYPNNPSELVGCRAWAYLDHEQYDDGSGKAKTRCRVAIDRGDKGYLDDDATPPTAEMPTEETVDPFDDDVPF